MTNRLELDVAERPLLTAGMFTSRSDEWATPRTFYQRLDDEFHFELDPASTHENALCARHYTKDENGLLYPWWPWRTFLNPPFGRTLGLWVEKAYREAQRGCTVVCLLPARTDTRWFRDYVARASEVRFVTGRLHFGGTNNSAPFPTMIVVFRPTAGNGHRQTVYRVVAREHPSGVLPHEVGDSSHASWL